MKTSPSGLAALEQRRPEWAPWLAVVEHALQACASDAWAPDLDAAVIASPAPLLAGASIGIPRRAAYRLLERLVTTAVRTGTPQMATLRGVLRTHVDLPALASAAIARDKSAIDAIAAHTGASPEALDAIAALLAVPLLHACRRRGSALVPESWTESHCPICGAWPALVEVRGIERSRFFRCGRCGSEWHARMLECPYCAMDDHEQLVTLVPQQAGASTAVDACRSCRGYLKVLTRLQGCHPEQVIVEDLDTVDLDLAAVAEGYARPEGLGYAMRFTVTDGASTTGAPA